MKTGEFVSMINKATEAKEHMETALANFERTSCFDFEPRDCENAYHALSNLLCIIMNSNIKGGC